MTESSVPRWRRYLRLVRANVAADVDEELSFHMEMRVQRNISLGMSAEDARREALARFGDVSRYRDQLVEHDRREEQEGRREEYLRSVIQDLRFGWRSLRRAPGFALAAIATLALGIGANAAIFSVVDAILLRPLPFERPQDLVSIGMGSGGELVALKERLRSYSHIAAYTGQTHPIDDGEEAQRMEGAAITTNLLATLGAKPLLGRGFTEDEGRVGNNTVLIIGYALWQRQFGGDREVIGKQVNVEGAPFRIVGVMPPGFHFPSKEAQYWQPYAINLDNVGQLWGIGGKRFIGRLAPGVTVAQAQREAAEVWPTLRTVNPLWDPGPQYRRQVRVAPLQDAVVGTTGTLLWILFGCVVFVLLIGCINVANLLLARATARERELSVRAALGGGRGRLIRQLVTESLLLSALGSVLGVALAYVGVKWLVAMMPAGVPRAHEIAVNGPVLLFTALLAVLTGILFGVIPAVRATNFKASIAGFGRRATSGAAHQRVTGLLVAGEIALAVLLVIGSALLVRSFSALRGVEPGFETAHVIAARVSPPGRSYQDPARLASLYTTVLERMAAVPGVQSVAAVDQLPLAQTVFGMAARIEGQFEDGTRLLPMMDHVQHVTSGYFRTMGIPIQRGRAFTDADRGDQLPVAVVSSSVTRRFWPAGDAIGKRVGYPYASPWMTVVGIVPDTKQDSLRDTMSLSMYVPWQQRRMPGSEMWVLARSTGDPEALSNAIRAIVREVDRGVPVSDVRTMDAVLSQSVAKARFTMLLVGMFAVAALLLGAVGIYGMMSYVVGLRAQEMGIRLALGASPSQVLGMVVRRGAKLAAVGTAIGVIAALFATRSLGSLLYGISATDPLTFVAVPLLFLVVAMAASYAPARRATKVDPVRALRAD